MFQCTKEEEQEKDVPEGIGGDTGTGGGGNKGRSDKEGKEVRGAEFPGGRCVKLVIAVKRITGKGNYVAFGPEPDDNYIYNKKSGDEMMLKPNGKGSFVMDVSSVGGEKTEITVDSGAEENVCPWEWGKELFGTKDASTWMAFRNANGGTIEHYGARDVMVVSPF